jgi:hypothetical protein
METPLVPRPPKSGSPPVLDSGRMPVVDRKL